MRSAPGRRARAAQHQPDETAEDHRERIIQTLRHELCDQVLVLNEAHARQLLATYRRHYNDHRPHQARNQLPPDTDRQPPTVHHLHTHRLRRTCVLGGLINEYRYAA